MTITLKRIGGSTYATFGVLVHAGIPFAVTLEQPWADNQPNISCIPVGTYICQRIFSPRFGETFAICNVPDRTHILFHKGNRPADTQGCVLVAEEFAVQSGQPSVYSSARGFTEFMDKLANVEEFTLTIEKVYNG